MASQRELVEQLFEAALTLKPRERDAFLDEMCSGDPELKQTVEDLLAEDARAGSFLQHPPLDLLLKGVTPGTRLGQYEIVAPIGAGGMGEVFRARDLRVKREVAIKVLPRCYFSDPDRLRRFKKEAEAIAALNHPNILSLYDVGERDGAPYFVTELLEGETLREKPALAVPFPQRRRLKCAEQIARGLAAAHEKGIVHRDLKPENLFVTKDGRIKILDFGLAKLIQPPLSRMAGPTLTERNRSGNGDGQPAIWPPEQVRGKSVDHRGDIFAFGAILYEMLAGRRAFHKPTAAETMTAILNEDPPAISALTVAASPGLQRLVHRCLEKNPEQRFQSASDLAFALEALSDSGVSSTIAIGRKRPRTGTWILAGALAVLILIAGFLVRRVIGRKSVSKEHAVAFPLMEQRVTSNSPEAPVHGAIVSPDGKYVGYADPTGLYLRQLSTGETRPWSLPKGFVAWPDSWFPRRDASAGLESRWTARSRRRMEAEPL